MSTNLTKSQAYAIDEYNGVLHDTINGYLEGKVVLDNDKDRYILEIIREIDSIFESEQNRMHWQYSLELYVGVEDIIDNLQQYVGHKPAYTKATFDSSLAAEYARSPTSFILRLNLNTDAVDVIQLDTYDVSEVLINRDVVFNVISIYPVGHKYNPTDRILVDCVV